MIDQRTARRVAAAASLDADEVQAATVTNPWALVERALIHLEAFIPRQASDADNV
jgi:hypothetical protein